MATKTIDLAELGKFDGGKIAAALEAELTNAVQDCRDRPHVSKPRLVILQIEVEPVPDESTSDCDTASLSFQVRGKIPTRKSKIYSVGVRPNGKLYYAPDSPDNVDQKTLLPEPEEEQQRPDHDSE